MTKEEQYYREISTKRFKITFHENDKAKVKCPICLKSDAYLSWETMQLEETQESVKYRSHEEWEPDWLEYDYSATYECVECKQRIRSLGTAAIRYHENYDPRTGDHYIDEYKVFSPQFFLPSLVIFEPTQQCPKEVKKVLFDSFKLAFCDIPSAANKVRVALEVLISLEIPANELVNKTLHQRIPLLEAKYPTIDGIKDISLAIKWIGNAGSHQQDGVPEFALKFAYEAFEVILREIYETKKSTIGEMSGLVNTLKGKFN
ncbi:TPA: DUF4145 domain-containing protein [Yersinia enterocolitica]|uniref:DUF4145 domain-containing protein n=1 Tax=Yersinia enterocolitica TaxID=630 RepID=UPI002AC390CD|nr:DUF4145 domain-containing protein [Yersinia enterocolitica]HDL6705442.1 DUF4145 domain-containing protein [Yersinia enterocolitica]HEN3234679.1 DUF4145 domain-containing protein [Yersinia enterocolitica]HEN3330136.1 DUF4145 domain-containing protein [Yersinia enterocolitica]HEN3408335.1 DUF4145 domain-containing protein [Yersinia enterocolitica]